MASRSGTLALRIRGPCSKRTACRPTASGAFSPEESAPRRRDALVPYLLTSCARIGSDGRPPGPQGHRRPPAPIRQARHHAARPVDHCTEFQRRRGRRTARMWGMGEVLRAIGLRKTFKNVEAVRGIDVIVAARRAGRSARPERRRQDHDAADDARGDHCPTPARSRSPGIGCPASAPRRWPSVGFVAGYLPLPDRLKVREALGVFAGWYGVRDHKRRRRRRRWNASASPTSPTGCAARCRAVSARSSASSRPRCTSRRCSCSTSRPPHSTRTSP